MQRERIDVAAERADDEGHMLRHKTGDERHVARQPIELGDSDFAFLFLRRLQRRLQLWPSVERVRALAGFNLGELGDDLEAFSRGERLTAARCASRPRPDRPCWAVLHGNRRLTGSCGLALITY